MQTAWRDYGLDRPPTIREIVDAVMRLYSIDSSVIFRGENRGAHLSARGTFVACLRYWRGMSYPEVAEVLGRKGHSSTLRLFRGWTKKSSEEFREKQLQQVADRINKVRQAMGELR